MSLQATIVTQTCMNVSVQSHDHTSGRAAPQEAERSVKLSSEELSLLEKRNAALVQLINDANSKGKESPAAVWEEWGRNTRKKAKHKIAELKEELEKLQEEKDYCDVAISQQATELFESQQAYNTLLEKYQELKKKAHEQAGTIESLEKRVERSASEHSQLQAQITDLTEIDQRERKLLRDRREKQSQTIAQKEEELKKEREKSHGLQSQLQLKADLTIELQAENERLKFLIAAQEKEAAAIPQRREEEEIRWKRQLEEIREQLEEQKRKCAKFESETKQASVQVRDMAQFSGVIAALVKEKEDLQATVGRQTKDLIACITERDALRDLRDDRAGLITQINDLKKMIEEGSNSNGAAGGKKRGRKKP